MAGKPQQRDELKYSNLNEEQLAHELAKVQQQVTGLGDSIDLAGSNCDSQDGLSEKLESAKKVMELLDRMRPPRDSDDINETVVDPATRRLRVTERDQDFLVDEAATSEPPTSELPSTIGRFQIKRLLGQGGFGLVFLAHDPDLKRMVALKVPSFRGLMDNESRARFKREARVVALLSHPNIVPVFEVGNDGSISFIASEFISGSDLAKWVANNGALNPRTAAEATIIVADAIQHAHQRGVLHRDLKPGNILIENSDHDDTFVASTLRVADFGLAKLLVESEKDSNTRTGSVIGTPAYSAPEQLQPTSDSPPTEAADIYSLGALLYFLTTGRAPFQANGLTEIMSKVVHDQPTPPKKHSSAIPDDLSAICLKCLAKEPSNRYSSAHELSADLHRFLNGEVTVARPAGLTTRTVRWVKRNPFPTALLAVIATSVLIVSLLLMRSEKNWQLSETRQQQVLRTSKQLHQAIDKLFLTVADTPELKQNGFEYFRKQLLDEASTLVSQLVSEKPEDLELFELYANTQLSFIKLSEALGENDLADSGAAVLIADIGERLDELEPWDPIRNRLLITLTESDLIRWKFDENLEERLVRQQTIMNRVNNELGLFDNNETKIFRASALSQVAARSVFTRDFTTAREIQDQAITLWDQIPIEQLIQSKNLEQFAACYSNSLRVVAGSKNKDKALPIAQRAIEVLEPQLQNNLAPESRFHLANIYRLFGFIVQNSDPSEAVRLTDVGHAIAVELANDHPSIPAYRVYLAESNFSRAYLPFVGKELETAEPILLENVELTRDLLESFPGKAAKIKNTRSNSLWLLGLIYGQRRQWQNQLDTLKQSLEIAEENLRFTESDYLRVQTAGLRNEIGFCHIRLKNMAEGVPLLVESVQQLEELCAADSENGQAHRYLPNSVDNLSEGLRRAGNFDDAAKWFERLTELNQGTVAPNQMTDHIDVVVGLQDYTKAQELLNEYTPNLLEQKSTRLSNSELLACAVASIDAAEAAETESAQEVRRRLVSLACQLVGDYLNDADDKTIGRQKISERKDLDRLKNEDEFIQAESGN